MKIEKENPLNMNILDFINSVKDFDVTLDYVFEYSDHSVIDEEYSFEGKGCEYEEAMKGYDFQFDFCMADFAEINIDVEKKTCKLVYVTFGIEN